MPSYKDSPKPLRKSDPTPLFKEADDGYIVRALSPMERERRADGSQHTNNRGSALRPRGLDSSLYLGDDKIDKSTKSVSAQMESDVDPDEVIKAFMNKSENTDDDPDDLEKNKAKLGSGARFKKVAKEAAEGGAKDPDAVAAAVGRKKYGAKKFAKLAAAGKK